MSLQIENEGKKFVSMSSLLLNVLCLCIALETKENLDEVLSGVEVR